MNCEIYYINLNERNDRKIEMEKLLRKINLNYYRIDAINGNNLNYDKLLQEKIVLDYSFNDYNKKDKKLNMGEIGCYLSHVSAWNKFIESRKNYGIFFEDDIVINELYFNKVFNRIIDELIIYNFDILFLSRNAMSNSQFYEGQIIGKFFYKPSKIMYGAHSYILSKKGAKKFINYFNTINSIKEVNIIHKLDQFDLMFDYYYQIFNQKIEALSIKPWFMFRNQKFEELEKKDAREFIFFQKDIDDSDTRKII
jgi:GR25 family glycosyltransferase involved in LPS biosynthesis